MSVAVANDLVLLLLIHMNNQGTDLHAVQAVYSRGGIIAYPTEAVWGLGCDPFNQDAVEKLLSLKQRNIEKGLILIAADIKQFALQLAHLSATQYKSLQDSWPGHSTWLVPNNGSVPKWISGKYTSVALRVSSHPIVIQLCSKVGLLVSTSANITGDKPANTWQEVVGYFQQSIDYIYLGSVGSATEPSTITDLLSGKKLR